ncbi:MAG TPA: glycoside hydrolase family 76 protein [Polyangiales bacterium]|nr:glycoside hydrolase family 76 protein [Polyangiales bacterium]
MRIALLLCAAGLVATACESREAGASEDASTAPSDTPSAGDASLEYDAGGHGEPNMDAGAQRDAAVSNTADASGAMGGSVDAASRDAGPMPMDAAVGDAGNVDMDELAADVAYDAFVKVFYTLHDGKGFFVNNSGTATANAWWTQAELIEMAIDAYERKPSDAYKTLLIQLVDGFVDVHSTDWSYNDFNDDISWMVIASLRAFLITNRPDFLSNAKQNWDVMYSRAWTSDYGGGLSWKVDVDSKNACVNGPGAIGAYLLFKATGEASYLNKAKAIYAWERKTLFDAKTGAVYDNVNPNGGDKWTFTYNSGTFIGAANYLYQETGDEAYLSDAKLAADFVKSQLSDADGLIKENDVSGDGAAFKPIMFRWLSKFVVDNDLQAEYLPWLQFNANRAWANRRLGDNISWNNWKQATPHRILDSHGAMATVQILQVVSPGGPEVVWYNSAPQDGRKAIEAERCDEKRGMTIEASEAGGEQLGGVTDQVWARYGQVDFGASAPSQLQARAAVAEAAGGSIEIHIDSLTGPVIGTLPLASTGSWTTYGDFSTTVSLVTGAHDIYLSFKSSPGKTYICNLNWIKFR